MEIEKLRILLLSDARSYISNVLVMLAQYGIIEQQIQVYDNAIEYYKTLGLASNDLLITKEKALLDKKRIEFNLKNLNICIDDYKLEDELLLPMREIDIKDIN